MAPAFKSGGPVCRGCAKGANAQFGPVKAWACLDLNQETGLCVECAELGGWEFEHVSTYDRALCAAAGMMASQMAGQMGPDVVGRVIIP